MADKTRICSKCIHKEVCKTAESCDGYVSGCKHFNPGWIPVTERLPKSDTKVLVSVKGRDEALIGWYDADWEDWVVEENLSERKLLPVTHWQEKPKPAKENNYGSNL